MISFFKPEVRAPREDVQRQDSVQHSRCHDGIQAFTRSFVHNSLAMLATGVLATEAEVVSVGDKKFSIEVLSSPIGSKTCEDSTHQ